MTHLKYFVLIVLAVSLAVGCDSSRNGTITKNLSAEEFQALLLKEKGVLIDVRSQEEYAEAHINNAINIDVNAGEFRDKIESLDRDKPYFLYCRSGKRSSKALNLMKDAGFKKLYNLEGGISEWQEKKFPVIQVEEAKETDKSN